MNKAFCAVVLASVVLAACTREEAKPVIDEVAQQRQESKEWGQRKGGLDLQAAMKAQKAKEAEDAKAKIGAAAESAESDTKE